MPQYFRKFQPSLSLSLFLSLFLSLSGLWIPYFNIDETTNALFGQLIVNGSLNLQYFMGNPYILTHYLYALVYWIFREHSLLAIHVVHALWKCGTILSLYWAGKELSGKKAGFWSAFFYSAYSICFMSKDFQTPSAESFSLLPAVLAVGFFFRATQKEWRWDLVLCGIFAAMATMFKAPIGVLIIALNISVLIMGGQLIRNLMKLNLSFVVTLLLPVMFVMPFGSGFVLMMHKMNEVNTVYIKFYHHFSFAYWGLKYFIRSALIFTAVFGMFLFAMYNYKVFFHLRNSRSTYWQKVFFLFLWFFLAWSTVTLGKRVFYHYFVFLLAPLALLSGSGLRLFDLCYVVYQNIQRERLFSAYKFCRKYILIFIFVPTLGFFIEGCFNLSTLPPKLNSVIEYIQKNTTESDRIFVWGSLPQIYFLSHRMPASTFFWADVLAGTMPGSPAMEYMRATKGTLDLKTLIQKDLSPKVFAQRDPSSLSGISQLSLISESELFTLKELIERIDEPNWKKVFIDFLARPPKLILDSAPANIRGFGYYPIYKYELLRRFVKDNYELVGTFDRLVVYSLKTTQ